MIVVPGSKAIASGTYLSLDLVPNETSVGDDPPGATLVIRFDWVDHGFCRIGLGPTAVDGQLFDCEMLGLRDYQVTQGFVSTTLEESVRSKGMQVAVGLKVPGAHAKIGTTPTGSTREVREESRTDARVVMQEMSAGKRPRVRFRPFGTDKWILEGIKRIEIQLSKDLEAEDPRGSFYCDVAKQLTVADRDGKRLGLIREILVRAITRQSVEPKTITIPFSLKEVQRD